MVVVATPYPLTFPTTVAPVSTRLELVNLVGFARSPFSAAGQAQHWGGYMWRMSVVMPPMLRAAADEYIAFFHKLRGRYGYFRMPDFDRRVARGTWGTPLVKGGSQVGNTLDIDGVGNATVRYAGDMFQLEDRLYQLVAPDTADGSGNATITFEPPLRSSPADNAAITFTSAKGLWRLDQNSVPWDADAVGVHGLSFTAIEKL